MSGRPPAAEPDDGPAGPSARPPDLIGVALGALISGAASGAVAVTAGILAFRTSLAGILPLLLFAGIVAAATVAWTLTPAIADWWRRGLTAALAIFGAMMLTALTAPADRIGGQGGLAGYGIATLLVAALAARHARRSAAHDA